MPIFFVKNIEFKISRINAEWIVMFRCKILGHQVPSGALCVIIDPELPAFCIQFQSAVDPWVGAYNSLPTKQKKDDDVCNSIMTMEPSASWKVEG